MTGSPTLLGVRPTPGDQAPHTDAPSIHVLDADAHTGIGGAVLRIVPPGSKHATLAPGAFSAVADHQGVVTVPNEKWAEQRHWVFTADGHRPTVADPTTLLASAAQGVVSVFLHRGASVSGKVVTPWGSPVADAEVVAYGRYGADFDGTEAFLLPGAETAGEILRSRSDATGAFRLTGFAQFPIRIQASKAGFAWKAHPEQSALFVDRETAEARLVLRPLVAAGLRVIDGRTGDIVRDFHVQTESSDGPVVGWAEASCRRPGRIQDLGFAYREGEWWVTGCHGDSAASIGASARLSARVTAPGYLHVSGVELHLKALDPSTPATPLDVRLTPTEPLARGLLRVQVVSSVPGLRLPWANVRARTLDPSAEDGPQPMDWTFRVDLDDRGRAVRALELPLGTYRVQLTTGTGWATWTPLAEDPWATTLLEDPGSEVEAQLQYRAGLLRIACSQKSGEPVGMFNLAVHDATAPQLGVRRAVAPMLAYLSEESERWWLEYGHPYRAHLRMEPGAIDLLLPPGRYSVKVTKAGFPDPDLEVVDLDPGEMKSLSFALEPASNVDGR